MTKYHLGCDMMMSSRIERSICQHEQRNIMVLIFLMVMHNHGEMLQERFVEPLHHSNWLWVKSCGSSLFDFQQRAHLWDQVWLEIYFLVRVQLHWEIIMQDPVNLAICDMLCTICWNNRPPQEYADCPLQHWKLSSETHGYSFKWVSHIVFVQIVTQPNL